MVKFALQRNDILGLGAFFAFPDGELDFLAFIQRTKTTGVTDGAIVHEEIFAFILGNETIALTGVEPFHNALDSI